MNRHLISGLPIFLLLLCVQLTGNAQTTAEIQEKYSNFLDDRGMFSKIDDDGDVQFIQDGKTYYFDVDEDDPRFFRIVLSRIWDIESEEERAQVLRAMNIANMKIKVAKMYTVDEWVWVSVEIFMDEEDDYEAYFDRSMGVIAKCIEYFIEEMP